MRLDLSGSFSFNIKEFWFFLSGFHYEACNETDKMDFEKAIETIAVAFSSK